MAEYVRMVSVEVLVDTNKATYLQTFDTFAAALEYMRELADTFHIELGDHGGEDTARGRERSGHD